MPVDCSTFCHTKATFLLISSCPPPPPKPDQFFFFISTEKPGQTKVKAEEKRQDFSSHLNTEISHAPSGILAVFKLCLYPMLFGVCSAVGPQNSAILRKEREKNPKSTAPHYSKIKPDSFSFNKISSIQMKNVSLERKYVAC